MSTNMKSYLCQEKKLVNGIYLVPFPLSSPLHPLNPKQECTIFGYMKKLYNSLKNLSYQSW